MRREIDRQVFETAPVGAAGGREHRFHARDRFTVVSWRRLGHFHVNCRIDSRIIVEVYINSYNYLLDC